MDKTALKHKIQTLEGLTNEEKSVLLELLNKEKKYGLVWENKPEDVEYRLREHLPVFEEVKCRAILSDSPDAPNHILIEGDNLEALTALCYTHEGKIDVIYIDPPYNTGNKDFTYNDDYVDKEDGFRHSKWLSFINKRLKIAKRLMSDDGVIFISIDDNEQANIKLLCNSIWGENNFVACVLQKSRDSISGDLLFSPNHNYLLVYAKVFANLFARKDQFRIPQEVDETKFKNPDNDPRGPWKLSPVDGPGGARKGNPYYEFLGITGYYRYSKDMMQKYYDEGLIVKRKNSLGKKYFLSQALAKKGVPPTTWWDDAGTTTLGTKMLKEILPNREFTNPKPISLIKRCFQLAASETSTILDFFAGSGTTLHATMQLNSEDGGHRQCILVTNNENNICEEVTYERNKRVINGYTTPKGEQVEGLKNNSLRYYKTELLPREKSPRNMRALMAAATELLCIKEDLYEESKRFGRYKTNPKTIRYFEKGDKRMLIIFCEELADQIAEEIKTLDFGGQRLKIYIFSPDRYAFDDNFYEVQDKVQLIALPAAIYDAYRRVLPKRIDKPLLEVEADERPTYTITAGETPTLPEATQQSIDFNFE
ncbi:MAG: site-specific DNA-methyltransferase [Prevotella sp.]|nr:site-specific DNA-methyltransferase [Prevotella sp.]